MKKTIMYVLLIIVSISLLACSNSPVELGSSTTTEVSTTTEASITTTEISLITNSPTSTNASVMITTSQFADALANNFDSDDEEILESAIYYGETDQYLDTVGYISYEYPYFVDCCYQVLPSERDRERTQYELLSVLNERLEEYGLSDNSFVKIIDEDDYGYCYFCINGVTDFANFNQESLPSAESFVSMYGLNRNEFSWIGFYYFAGDFMVYSNIATDCDEGREAMDIFISELGLPEV